MYDLNRSNNLAQPYDSFPDYNFDDVEGDECLSEFCFCKRDLAFLAESYIEVNELKLIISRCLIRLAQQISVPTDKDLSKPLILRLKIRTATKVLMVSTLLSVLEFHHNKLFDISVVFEGEIFD